MVQVDPVVTESPVLLAERVAKGFVLHVLMAVRVEGELFGCACKDFFRFLLDSTRGDDALHVPPPVDFGVVAVRVGSSSDPAVGRVAQEI